MSQDVIDAEYKALAVREPQLPAAPQLLDALRPAERVALMTEISNVVKDVIEKQGWYQDIKGKKHILIQGWTFIGGLGGCSAKTTHTEAIDGGFKAHAVVVRCDSGVEVGAADQVCMRVEPFGRGKQDNALIGMASTRACSRALSTVFRHVVELAGYSATPAEEMGSEGKETPVTPAPEPYILTAADRQDLREAQKALAWDNRTLGDFIAFVLGSDRRTLHEASAEEVELVRRGLRLRVSALEDEMASEADDSVGEGLKGADSSTSRPAAAAPEGNEGPSGADTPSETLEYARDRDGGGILHFTPTPDRVLDLGPAEREIKALRQRQGTLRSELKMSRPRAQFILRGMFASVYADVTPGEESATMLSLPMLQAWVRCLEEKFEESKVVRR